MMFFGLQITYLLTTGIVNKNVPFNLMKKTWERKNLNRDAEKLSKCYLLYLLAMSSSKFSVL